jgi:hypothetical protein
MMSGLTRREERELARLKQRVADLFAQGKYKRAGKALRRIEALSAKRGPLVAVKVERVEGLVIPSRAAVRGSLGIFDWFAPKDLKQSRREMRQSRVERKSEAHRARKERKITKQERQRAAQERKRAAQERGRAAQERARKRTTQAARRTARVERQATAEAQQASAQAAQTGLLGVLAFGQVGSAKISPTFRLQTNEAAHLLQGLVAVDLSQIKGEFDRLGARGKGQFPVLQGIQKGTIRYKRYDPREHWKTWREIVMSGTGDCEDLSAAVVAELRYNGVPARTYVYQSAPKLYHVVVSTERWGLMDPSRAAGMEGNG